MSTTTCSAVTELEGIRVVFLISPFFFGNIFGWALLALLSVQVYNYWQLYPNDRISFKILVYTVFIADVIQTGLLTNAGWEVLGAHWGDPNILFFLPPSVNSLNIMVGTIAFIVQSFYAWRIYTLAQSIYVPMAIIAVSLTQLVGALVGGIGLAVNGTAAALPLEFVPFSIWLVASFVCDIMITLSMVVLLSKARHSSFNQGTQSAISRLISRTLQSGALTVFCAGLEFILYVISRDNNLHVNPAFILGKLYSNSLMASLNARRPDVDRNDPHIVLAPTSWSSQQQRSAHPGTIQVTAQVGPNQQVWKTTEIVTRTDGNEESNDGEIKKSTLDMS